MVEIPQKVQVLVKSASLKAKLVILFGCEAKSQPRPPACSCIISVCAVIINRVLRIHITSRHGGGYRMGGMKKYRFARPTWSTAAPGRQTHSVSYEPTGRFA